MKKIIYGFIIQEFNEYGIFRGQEFIQDGDIVYENEKQELVDNVEPPLNQEIELVQPIGNFWDGVYHGILHHAKTNDTIYYELVYEYNCPEDIAKQLTGYNPE